MPPIFSSLSPWSCSTIIDITKFLQCNEIKKGDSNLAVIGKTSVDNDKEEYDNDADDDDADNVEESEGEEFEQETSWWCPLPFYINEP